MSRAGSATAGGLSWATTSGEARRPRLPGLVPALGLLALALSLAPGPERWQLDLALAAREPWRLWSGHLVHWSADHLAWDLAVFVGLGLACERASRRRTAAALALAAPLIAFGAPLLTPGLTVYRGLSGLDSALFALLAVRCLGRPSPAARAAGSVALVALAAKTVWELATGTALFLPESAGIAVVPAAHLLGGLAGAAAALVPAADPARDRRL